MAKVIQGANAVRPDGTCIRCSFSFGRGTECSYCGVGVFRVVKRIRRNRKAGGKRGMNSGSTGSAKRKR